MSDLIFKPWERSEYEARANYGDYRYMVPEFYRWKLVESSSYTSTGRYAKVWYDDTRRQYSIVALGKFEKVFFDDENKAKLYFDEVVAKREGLTVLTDKQYHRILCMT